MPVLQDRNKDDQTREYPEKGYIDSLVVQKSAPKPKSSSTRKGYKTFLIGLLISALLGLGLGYLLLFYEQYQANRGQANNPSGDNTSQAADPTIDDSSESGDLAAIKPPSVQTTATPLPAPQTLNLQVNDPSGALMQLTNITFAEDSTTLELTVTNNSRNPIKLSDNQDMVLKDDLGNQYNLVPEPENPELVVQPGTTLNGQFVFLGQIPPSATTLTLATNDRSDNQTNSPNPKMVVANIPIQGR